MSELDDLGSPGPGAPVEQVAGLGVTIVKGDYGLPYSKGLMAQSLMACGLPPDRAFAHARALEERLAGRPSGQITVPELWEEAEEVLAGEPDETVIMRFRQWRSLGKLEKPLFVLVGGATGTGKSTVATQLAHRLGITRVIGTDSIRQVLRAFFSHEFMPAVHYSSFDAEDAVRMDTSNDRAVAGFLRQTESVAVALNAIAARSVEERTPMVLEGVHLVPGVLRPEIAEGAVVAQLMVAVEEEELHKSHFHLRGFARARPQQRYLDSFDRIRKLQDHLVERANEAGMPIVEGSNFDEVLKRAMGIVLDSVAVANSGAGAQATGRKPDGDGAHAPKDARDPSPEISQAESSASHPVPPEGDV